MNQVKLGRSNLGVWRIAFGASELGGDWGATDESAAIATIRHAADHGINFFDAIAAADLTLDEAKHAAHRRDRLCGSRCGRTNARIGLRRYLR